MSEVEVNVRAINWRLVKQFLDERYWERHLFKSAPKAWQFRVKRCISRSGVLRKSHELDRDGRCFFCDFLDPKEETVAGEA